MKTDRELLELAARAAGIELVDKIGAHFIVNDYLNHGLGTSKPWNPLENDGDALRLAVKLNIDVLTPSDDQDNASTILPSGETGPCIPVRSDHYAATRRAIVRAAAEIALRT